MSNTESQVSPKFIDAVANTFPEMDNTDRIATWAKENTPRVEEVMGAYFDLLQDIEDLDTDDDNLQKLVPHAIELKKACDTAEVPLPRLEDFGGLPGLLTIFRSLRDSKGAILAGQDIKREKLEKTSANIMFAVGTTALDLDNEALGPPILGHLMERAVYRHLSDRGVDLPKNPKDSILHPQADMLKLRYVIGQETPLIEVYTHPNLGWSSMEKFESCREEYYNLEVNTFLEIAQQDDWELFDGKVIEICNQPGWINWTNVGLLDPDGNTRDLAISILENTKTELEDSQKQKLGNILHDDESEHLQRKAAIALYRHGERSISVQEKLQDALLNDDELREIVRILLSEGSI